MEIEKVACRSLWRRGGGWVALQPRQSMKGGWESV